MHIEGQRFGGMLYIGNRPTLEKHNEKTIEVNIFDFNQTIYGKIIQLEFIKFIRGDQKFEGLENLKTKLAEDKKQSLAILQKKN